jgi:proteasome lid subunit RPN8/RPN11
MTDFTNAFESAKRHARLEYPSESCGLILNGVYVACENTALPISKHVESDADCGCKLCAFAIDMAPFVEQFDQIDMVIHSHPNGPIFPSKVDARQQLASGLPWGMIALDEERTSAPVVWGGTTEIAPIIGREFMHFVSDCYTLIKDVYSLGKDELAQQDITGWPFDPIDLPEQPRDNGWWETGQDLYIENYARAGFRQISASEAAPGDVFLMKVLSDKLNHGGMLIGNGLILHHLPSRFSRREPAAIWARNVDVWLRYEGFAK